MELHLVDAFAEAVVRAQTRRIRVGLEAPVDSLLGAGETAKVADRVLGPRRAFPLELPTMHAGRLPRTKESSL